MLKRPRDAFDSSPASSTPPQRPVKRFHIDSDASSDAFAYDLPSDSPSNPFGRFKRLIPRDLPQTTPFSEHLVLRFQLSRQAHSVHRVVAVPANYTFWHLHRLTQFLFGWKDIRKEKHPLKKSQRIERRTEHIFTVQKQVVFYVSAKYAGMFKNGSNVVHVASNIKELRPRCNDDLAWEREECYTLGNLWHRPGSSDISRAVIYEYDVLSPRKEAVYISIYGDSDKLKSTLRGDDEMSNTPLVLLGSGLPDDDEDDEDFALDLQQWNELHAFENFMLSQEDGAEESDDDCPSTIRLAEEQALVKRRMSAPLPSRLPLDEEEHENPDEDVPPKLQMLTTKVAAITVPKPEKQFTLAKHGVRLPDPDESREVGVDYPALHELSPVKKSTSTAGMRLPDPDESGEIDTDHKVISHVQPAPRKRMPLALRLPDPEESCEIGVDYAQVPRKRLSHIPRLPDMERGCEIGADHPILPRPVIRKRIPFEPRLPDPEESCEVGVDYPEETRKRNSLAPRFPGVEGNRDISADFAKALRKRGSFAPRLPDPEESREIDGDYREIRQPAPRKRMFAPRLPDPDESREIGADYPEKPRKRVVPGPHLPDPDESREIGDDRYIVYDEHRRRTRFSALDGRDPSRIIMRKSVQPFQHTKRVPMRGGERRIVRKVDAEKAEELVESEVEI